MPPFRMTEVTGLILPAVGVGICWGSIMGTPYVMLASCIPPRERASTWASST